MIWSQLETIHDRTLLTAMRLHSALSTLFFCLTIASADATGFDCSRFAKNDDGSWRVLQALQIRGPRGRIDFIPDETYKEGNEKMGLDLAKLLNANCDKH